MAARGRRFLRDAAWMTRAPAAALLFAGAFANDLARADDDDAVKDGIAAASIANSLPARGDPHGVRKKLSEHGIVYSLIYTNDVLSNLHGGEKRGTINQGKLEGTIAADLEKLVGWQGLSFFANGFFIHNTGRIRRDYVGGINTISNIEAVPATRLSEVWLEQKFAGGAASIRFGQLAADPEFFFTDLSTMFLQSDWPTILAVNLPSGGASYPLATPGVRLKVEPNKNTTLLLAVLNGDPAGPGPGDDQIRNHYGLNFRVNDPPFMIGEAQFRWNQGKTDTGLAGTLKLGGWGHLGKFEDKRFASDGTLLAAPNSNGIPLEHRGDFGIYGVVDQQIYRPRGAGPDRGIFLFGRSSVSPNDRNEISFFADGGIVFAGMIPSRPDDRFGASAIYAKYSSGVRGFERDTIFFSGVPGPVRDYALNIEMTYMAQIIPGWTVQPNVQFIRHPDGLPGKDARVVGVRSIWKY